MGYRDTKTEGPAANAVGALITLTQKWHGLNDVQSLSIFSELAKQTPENAPVPTNTQWNAWLDRAHRKVTQSTRCLSDARRASLHARLDNASEGLPSARVWFALRHLDAESKSRTAALNGYLNQIARIAGRPTTDVKDEFQRRVGAVGTARSNGDGRQTRTVFHGHVPSDYATITVLADMRREAIEAADITAIEHIDLPVGFIASYGYDTDEQRFEVNMAGSVYAYRVPAKVITALRALDHTTDAPASFIANKVFPNPAFAWAAGQSAMRICPACSTPVAQVHVCNGPATAPYAAGVVVDLDPGAERVAPDGTVLVLLRSPGVRNDLAVQGEVTVPIVVITAPDDATDALGSRYTITGDLVVRPDYAVTDALSCSCPAPKCSHIAVAGQQVHHMVLWGTVPAAAEFATL